MEEITDIMVAMKVTTNLIKNTRSVLQASVAPIYSTSFNLAEITRK